MKKETIEEVQNVAVAFWEPDGSSTSSFLHTQHQTTMRTDLNLNPQPLFLPIILIKEEKIDHELQKTEHTED